MGAFDRFWRTLIVALVGLIVLAGCASVQFVPAYDEQIDRGLTDLYADTVAFVDRMSAAHGTPAGSYGQNVDFHDRAAARVDALIARAEANQVLGHCPTTKATAAVLDRVRLPAEVRSEIGSLPEGGCELVLMRLIRGGFDKLRAFHQAQGAVGISPSARGPLIDGGVGALIRAGMAVEIAKRAGG